MQRCSWAATDPLLRAYHDEEWGVPQYDPRALWEMLMLEGFQAGLAWITVLKKRDAFRAAFAGFDPAKVARFDRRDVARLMLDPGIIRASAKIDATIEGARAYCEMAERGERFDEYCWSFTEGQVLRREGDARHASTPLSEAISRDLKSRGFRFVGPTIAYAWLQAIGVVNDHDARCFRRDEV